MFDFWQGGNIYVPDMRNTQIGGTATINLPGGLGTVNIGGSSTNGGNNASYPGGVYQGACPVGYIPTAQGCVRYGNSGGVLQQNAGLGGLFNDPLILLLLIALLIFALKK